MSFELFVALRYLFTRRKHSFISAISLVSVAGVALGVAALIVVLGVMNGFSSNLRDKILGVNAHLIVTSTRGPFAEHERHVRTISSLPGVKGAMPFIYSEVMVSTGHGVKGAALRGIDPGSATEVLSLQQDMVSGSLGDLDIRGKHPGVIMGRSMARRLLVDVGDTVHILSPSGRKSAAGFAPEIKTFRVAGTFDTGMYEYDSSLVYVDLGSAQDMLGFEGDLVTGLEVRLHDLYRAEEAAGRIKSSLAPSSFVVQTWMEMNQSLFSALKLEKTAMGVILVMIVLVGSFSIITTLIMLVMEKKQDIAVMMSMGAKPANIRRIFLWQGTVIGLLGTALGFAFGLLLSFLLEKYQFIKLPSDVYYMEHLPIQLEALDLTLIGVAAMVLCFLATLYPASQAARTEPAEVLRHE
jgi:lipoprotein-releasing system permease protein